jgi:hypothetical protein
MRKSKKISEPTPCSQLITEDNYELVVRVFSCNFLEDRGSPNEGMCYESGTQIDGPFLTLNSRITSFQVEKCEVVVRCT